MAEISRRKFLKGTSVVAAAAAVGTNALAEAIKERKIVDYAIFPGIGICRIGDSKLDNDIGQGCFIGPEMVTTQLTPQGVTRDATGALKRQAARFRIYGIDKDGRAVREITADEAKIDWEVELANKKSEWFRFIMALDIDEAKGNTQSIRRNAKVTGKDREDFIIRGGKRTISGKNTKGARYRFNSGKFKGTPVELGEVRTDDKGRLVVISAKGRSESVPPHQVVYDPNDPDTFNNADNWFDDMADGPVRATITFKGQRPYRLKASNSSWVAVAPPNYAPDIIGWRTFYELLENVYYNAKMKGYEKDPPKTSFSRHVLPLLQRYGNLQWVNQRISDVHCCGNQYDFQNLDFIKRLADKKEDKLRREIYDRFRTPENPQLTSHELWPRFYGDSFGSTNIADAPNNNFIVPRIQALHLQRWVDGDYESDLNKRAFEALEADEQADALNHAALHYCLADAFHPGCELTWPMRHAEMYSGPFRIKQVEDGQPAPSFKEDVITSENYKGVFHAQSAGDLTKWMAIPWQGDTAFCRSGYEPAIDPYLPTFWPARVPNQVMSLATYQFVTKPLTKKMAADMTKEELEQYKKDRRAAFLKREHWLRMIKGRPADQILSMVGNYHQVGVIEQRKGLADDDIERDLYPRVMFVETLPPDTKESIKVFSAGAPGTRGVEPLHARAGFESEEVLEEFQNIRIRKPRP